MGLWSFLRRLFFGRGAPAHPQAPADPPRPTGTPLAGPVRLAKLRFVSRSARDSGGAAEVVTATPAHSFSFRNPRTGEYLDLRVDGDSAALRDWGLPVLESVQDLAGWLNLPVGKLAWLTDRFGESSRRPRTVGDAHYFYFWKRKRGGGDRLIESPKQRLKTVQKQILEQLLNHVPLHDAAHAFRAGHSIVTNAAPHVGQAVVLKFDLSNFYPSVGFNRVVAIFRSFGYNREVALWLARLTTSALPVTMPFPASGPSAVTPYLRRHLPQGAPTSPALANLSAFGLDVRLSGLAGAFGARYTRYADDLTFSGPERLFSGLKTLIPLVKQVIRNERFTVHPHKQRVLRANQCQTVTGVVVNERLNVRREEYDRLKATLHNCIKLGPNTQNRESVPDFAAVLRGRIEFVRQLNPQRGDKLLSLYQKIRW